MSRMIFRILSALCGAVFLVSAGMLFSYWRSYEESAREYEGIVRDAVTVIGTDVSEEEETGRDTLSVQEETADLPALEIDFDVLKETNADCVAWIDFPGQDISYPVVKGPDNSQYLRLTFNGTENASGCIFQDSRNAVMMEDGNTVIYGHNMKNGSMFGKLKKYREQSHVREYPFFDIYTPEGAYRCQIIMAGDIRAEDDYYPVSFADREARSAYLRLMKKASWYELPEAVSGADVPLAEYGPPLVLLSTCTGGSDTYRLALLGQATEFYAK